MKMTKWLAVGLASVALGFAGCKKEDKIPDTQQVNGVAVEMPKLQQALSTTTNDEVRRLVTEAGFNLRYGDYMKSMMALDQLANHPSLTAEQKKIVNDVIEQEKKLAGGGAPAPAQ